MNLPSNQVIVGESQITDGFFTRLSGTINYADVLDADLTGTWALPKILSWELQAYLNRYFHGWKLLRRVQEHLKESNSIRAWKDIHYVIQVDTDADADTVASHLRKTDYRMPISA